MSLQRTNTKWIVNQESVIRVETSLETSFKWVHEAQNALKKQIPILWRIRLEQRLLKWIFTEKDLNWKERKYQVQAAQNHSSYQTKKRICISARSTQSNNNMKVKDWIDFSDEKV